MEDGKHCEKMQNILRGKAKVVLHNILTMNLRGLRRQQQKSVWLADGDRGKNLISELRSQLIEEEGREREWCEWLKHDDCLPGWTRAEHLYDYWNASMLVLILTFLTKLVLNGLKMAQHAVYCFKSSLTLHGQCWHRVRHFGLIYIMEVIYKK